MIDAVYHLLMKPNLIEQVFERKVEFSDEALALIDHIGQILAEEYVKLLKEAPDENQKEEE